MRLSLLMLQLFENNFQAVSAYCSFSEHNHHQLDPIAVLRTCGLFATNNTDPIIIRISAKLFDSSPVCVRSQLLPHPYRDRYCDDCCHPLPNLMAITREWPSLVPLPNTTHILLRPRWASKDSHQPVRPHTHSSNTAVEQQQTFAETIQSDRGQGYFWQSCFCGSQFRPGGHNCSSSLSLSPLAICT